MAQRGGYEFRSHDEMLPVGLLPALSMVRQLAELACSDIDILSFYLSGLTPSRVSSFGSLHHFKASQKPKEAGNATRCLDCAYEKDCVWSAKKIYVEPLSDIENRERVCHPLQRIESVLMSQIDQWARHVVDADVLDIENVTAALGTSPYGRCVYGHCGNDVVDHQVSRSARFVLIL